MQSEKELVGKLSPYWCLSHTKFGLICRLNKDSWRVSCYSSATSTATPSLCAKKSLPLWNSRPAQPPPSTPCEEVGSLSLVAGWSNGSVASLTESGLLHSDPISAMRPAVYPPVTLEGRPTANDNSPFHFYQELGESASLLPGLYKPAVPDPQHDTWISSFRALSSEEEPPSPPRTSRAHSSSSRPRTGIIFPLQPRQRRPDTYINVEAAALQRDDPLPSREVPTDLTRPAQRPARKRRRKRSSALYRPANRSPPRGHWCII